MARSATTRQARALRQNAPSNERLLWKLLRNRRLAALKFRRQFPLGPYVLDFVCLRIGLVVELDGPFHDPEHDATRDAWLAEQGFRVLRPTNREVASADHVLGRILEAAEQPVLKRRV